MDSVLRDACDNCHRRKTRCQSSQSGACDNCRASGRGCTFSPRSRMGRPRTGRQGRSKSSSTVTLVKAAQNKSTTANSQLDDTVLRDMAFELPQGSTDSGMLDARTFDPSRQTQQQNHQDPDMTLHINDESASPMAGWRDNVDILSATNLSLFTPSSISSDQVDSSDGLLADPFNATYIPTSRSSLDQPFFEPSYETLFQLPSSSNHPHIRSSNDAKRRTDMTQTSAEASGVRTPQSMEFDVRRQSQSDTSIIEIYDQLSRLLNSIHKSQPSFIKALHSEASDDDRQGMESLCQSVCSLCDVLVWLRRRDEDPPLERDDSLSSCMLLTTFVASTVADIYQQALDTLNDCGANGQKSPSSSDQRSLFTKSSLSSPAQAYVTNHSSRQQLPASTQSRLKMVSNLIAMDLHLEQLHMALSDPRPKIPVDQIQSRLERLRTGLQILIKEGRCSS